MRCLCRECDCEKELLPPDAPPKPAWDYRLGPYEDHAVVDDGSEVPFCVGCWEECHGHQEYDLGGEG